MSGNLNAVCAEARGRQACAPSATQAPKKSEDHSLLGPVEPKRTTPEPALPFEPGVAQQWQGSGILQGRRAADDLQVYPSTGSACQQRHASWKISEPAGRTGIPGQWESAFQG